MATEAYLLKYIEANKRYNELPARLRFAVSEEVWGKKVLTFCFNRGSSFSASPAATVCTEHEYYSALLDYYRASKRIFPYHLAEYICRVLRVTPFKYYRDILADAMKEEFPFDSIPNFTAADCVRVIGVGRNEYIATLHQAKSKKLLWRMNKGIVKDLLPQEAKALDPEPWWTVNLVNLSEVEHRSLTRAELDICQAAARTGGARYDTLNAGLVTYLYRRGLVWFDVPVSPDDHLSIPPLEGFVSNKTASLTGSDEVDPLETLMYQIFVAASDRVTVDKLASILNVGVELLRIGISVACRLKFCNKLVIAQYQQSQQQQQHPDLLASSSGGGFGSPPLEYSTAADSLSSLDLDQVLGGAGGIGSSSSSGVIGVNLATQQHTSMHGASGFLNSTENDDDGGSGGVALVVDAQVTGFLMMGALTPAVKKHSVTLFEGGRVYGTQVINELVEELKSSVEMASQFEGEMAALAGTAAALAIVMDCVRSGSGGRPIELLRKESVGSLSPSAAYRILSHSYNVVLPVAGLPNPPLPLAVHRQGPINYGPTAVATSPWLHLALYSTIGQGPLSLVLPAGTRLSQLPVQLRDAGMVLVWPWDAAAVRAVPDEPLVVAAATQLHALNHLLAKTALLVQPVAGGDSSGGVGEVDSAALMVSVPLPLVYNNNNNKNNIDSGDAWANFESSSSSADGEKISVIGYYKDGSCESVVLPAGCVDALQHLGLSSALGCLRLLRNSSSVVTSSSSTWLPISIVLGVPLQPLDLCRAVCENAAANGFLEASVCRRHEQGQRDLHALLLNLIAQHGGVAGPTPTGENGEAEDAGLAADVPLPVKIVAIDSSGRVSVRGSAAAGSATQGLCLV